MENYLLKKIEKKQNKDGPKKLPKDQICINLSQCKHQLFTTICEQRKWRVIKNDETNMNCDVIVSWITDNFDIFSKLKPYQKISHFPGIVCLAKKNYLAQNLQKIQKEFPDYYDFFPYTYCLPFDRAKLIKEFEDKKRSTYICKPEFSAEGRGIKLIRRIEDIDLNSNLICQKYIKKPFLINGLKFDMRVYVLVTSIDPLRVYVHREGLARFGTEQYQKPDDKNIKNQYVHLTNYSINKFSQNFFSGNDSQDFDKGFKRNFNSIWKEIEKKGSDPEQIFMEIKKICLKTIISVQPILKHIYNTNQVDDVSGMMCFELMGFDILLDEKLKPFILEVNHAPSFNTDTQLDLKVKTSVLNSTFDILSLDIQKRNLMIQEMKKKQKDRLLKGKRIKISKEERQQEKEIFLQKYYQNFDSKLGNFDQIYPIENPEEPYNLFMQYADELQQKKIGIHHKNVHSLKKVEYKITKKASSVLKQNKKEKSIISLEQRKLRIKNSVNRLYKIPIKEKENIKKNYLPRITKPQLSEFKTNIVTLSLDQLD